MTITSLPDSEILATTAPWPGEDDGDEGRQKRGLAIAATTPYHKVPGGWLTPSQADPTKLYRLARDEDGAFCECPDYTKRETACKHVFGLELVLERDRQNTAVKAQVGGHEVKNGRTAPVAVLDKPAPLPGKLPFHQMPETDPPRPPRRLLVAPCTTRLKRTRRGISSGYCGISSRLCQSRSRAGVGQRPIYRRSFTALYIGCTLPSRAAGRTQT